MRKFLLVLCACLVTLSNYYVCEVYAEDETAETYEEKAEQVRLMEEARYDEEEVVLASEKLVSTGLKTYWQDNGVGNRFFYDSKGKQFGTGNNIRVIDVSEHQGKIDWVKLKNSGKVDAAIIRCGYWSNYTDKYFVYAGAKSPGVRLIEVHLSVDQKSTCPPPEVHLSEYTIKSYVKE